MKWYLKILFSVAVAATTGCNQSEHYERETIVHLPSGSNPLTRFFSWSAERIPLVSAHRGGPSPGYPENCIATFNKIASETAAIIECDVAMTKDSVLILMHDETLDRTTTGSGKVTDRTYEEIRHLRLVDNQEYITNYRIPTLEEALYWAKEKAILAINLQREVPVQQVVSMIAELNAITYAGLGVIDVDKVKMLHRMNNELLIFTSIRKISDFSKLADSGVPFRNIIAFIDKDDVNLSLNSLLHKHAISCMSGINPDMDQKAAIKGYKVYFPLLENGIDIISTDRPVEVSKAISEYVNVKGKNTQIKEMSF